MKELLELSRKLVTYFGKAKFEVTGTELVTIAVDLQKFSQLVVLEENKLSDKVKEKESKNVLQKKETNKEKIEV